MWHSEFVLPKFVCVVGFKSGYNAIVVASFDLYFIGRLAEKIQGQKLNGGVGLPLLRRFHVEGTVGRAFEYVKVLSHVKI